MKNTFDLRKFLTENKNTKLSNDEFVRITGFMNTTDKNNFIDLGIDLINQALKEDPFFIDDVLEALKKLIINAFEEDQVRDTDSDFHENPLQDRINNLEEEEELEETAPGYLHDCAAHVVHETYGYGICLEGRHTLVETSKGRAKVTHYDVFFKNGSKIVENIPVEDLVIESIEEHNHGKRKK